MLDHERMECLVSEACTSYASGTASGLAEGRITMMLVLRDVWIKLDNVEQLLERFDVEAITKAARAADRRGGL